MRSRLKFGIIAGTVIVLASTFLVATPAHAATPTTVQYIAIPHPDDEFQAWSQVEQDPSTYKVFVLMTRGEQTIYCGGFGGKWSPTCEQKRMSSWTNFFSQMSATDTTIPGQFAPATMTASFPASSTVNPCRRDATDACVLWDRRAQIWKDTQNRGQLISFNLGDGDLTEPEVDWALDTVFANKAAFGIPELPTKNLVTGFANSGDPCVLYPNADHRALHLALYKRTYPVPAQLGATCDTPSSGIHFTDQVSESGMADAFRANGGAFPTHYGWLGGYPLDKYGQTQIFMGKQSFWVKTPGAVAAPVVNTTTAPLNCG